MLINGQSYSHVNCITTVLGVPIASLDNVTIDEEQVKEFHYGAGVNPVSWGIGEKKAIPFSFEMELVEFQDLEAQSPNGDVRDIAPFDIPFTILHPTKPYMKVYRHFLLKKTSVSTNVGTTSVKVKIEGECAGSVRKPF